MMQSATDKLISVLRWSEQYTKTDMVYLFKNSFWVFVGQFATSISAFVVMVVLANLVSKETLGEYRYLISIVSILMIFTLPGLDTALTQSTARGFEGQLNTAVRAKMRWGLIASVISFAMAGYYYINENLSLAASFSIVGALMPLFGAYFTYFFFLQGKQKFNEAALTQALARILFMVIMIGTALVMPTATALVAAFLIATIIGQNLGSWWTNRQYKQEDKPDPEMLGYGKHLTALGSAGIIASHIDKILIWFILGAIPTAVYTIATILPLESTRLGKMLAQVVLPRFSAQKELPPFWSTMRKVFLMFIAMFAVWAVYAFFAPYIFSIFFPDYMDAVRYSVLAMLVVVTTPMYIIRMIFISHKMSNQLNIIYYYMPILKTISLLFGLLLFGLLGSILSLVFFAFVELLVLIVLYEKSSNH